MVVKRSYCKVLKALRYNNSNGGVCSLATAAGRVTLSERRLIETANGERTERELPDEAAGRAVLRDRFGIDPAI